MSVPAPIPIGRLLEERSLTHLRLDLFAGSAVLDERTISNPRIQKPGLALAGYLPYVRPGRLQILGESEFAFLATLEATEAIQRLNGLVDLEVPVIVCCKGMRPEEEVVSYCEERGVPLICTAAKTADVIEGISAFLEAALAPRIQRHGVLVEVFSLGTLIVGEAGIGKSECALELIYKGHRLVADDIVVIHRTHNQGLLGTAHELLHNYLELRGVGIIDARKHFGMTATSESTQIQLVIQLVRLNKETIEEEKRWREQLMERPHAWMSTEIILGVEVPKYTMVVAPGRDVALMVETAVRKNMLAELGIEDERAFLDSINRLAAGDDDHSGSSSNE
ncbi:MAG: HPr(Ser) kinase/phosphatase [bacterium]|nr:HPr(Ser) kinase/phosphatase [bacterium]